MERKGKSVLIKGKQPGGELPQPAGKSDGRPEPAQLSAQALFAPFVGPGEAGLCQEGHPGSRRPSSLRWVLPSST